MSRVLRQHILQYMLSYSVLVVLFPRSSFAKGYYADPTTSLPPPPSLSLSVSGCMSVFILFLSLLPPRAIPGLRPQNWLGHDVHENHHDKPFYHVCVDPPDLVAGWTVAAACIFRLLLPVPLSLTVLAAYMMMGLIYEWTHYIVHTRLG